MTHERTQPFHSVRTAMLRIGIALLTILILGVIVGWFRLRSATQALADELEAWERAGGEMHVTALAPDGIADADNAAPLLQAAFGDFADLSIVDLRTLDYPETADHARLVLLVSEYRDTLDAVDAALARPKCVWPIRYELGPRAPRRHLAGAKHAARLLICDAYIASKRGSLDHAAARIQQTLRLADHVRTDPMLISHETAVAIDGIAINAMQSLFRRGGPPLDAIDALLARRRYRDQLHDAFLTEGSLWLSNIMRDAPGDPVEQIPLFVRPDALRYLSSIRGLAEHLSVPYYDRPLVPDIPDPPGWAFFINRVRADLNNVNTITADAETKLVHARLAIRLRAYKRVHGDYPDGLSILGQPALDPVDGRQVRYERKRQGFLLIGRTTSIKRLRNDWHWER